MFQSRWSSCALGCSVLLLATVALPVAAHAQQSAGDGAVLDAASADAIDAEAPAVPAAPEDDGLSDTERNLMERLRDAEERLDKVETSTLLQRLVWSGDYRTVVAGFRYNGPSPDGARMANGQPVIVKRKNYEQWLHRVRLNLRAEPLKNVRFTGRLTMFKRFGSNVATPFPQDSSESQVPRDTTPRFERAWLDWFVTPKLALSAGRTSYTDGPPADLRENIEQADATWGLQMVDGEYDTANITYSLSDRILVRGFYISWAFPRQDDLFSEFLPLTSGTKNLRILGGNIDIRTPELGNHFIQLGAYTVPEFRPFAIPIPSPMPPPNPTNAPPPFDGSLLFPSKMPSSLGSYHNLSALMLWKDIKQSGLDVFASFALGILNPNSESIEYPLGPNGESVPFLALSSAEVNGSTATLVYAGARLRMPLESDLAPKVGFEYTHASKYWISFATPKIDLVNRLANRGTSLEGYLIQPVNDSMFLRLDYTYVDTTFGGGFFGPRDPMFGGTAPPTTKTLHAFSLLIHANF